MYKAIMVPLADPVLEISALDVGVRIARASGARLHVVHVHDSHSAARRKAAAKALFDAAGWAADELDESVSFHVLELGEHADGVAETLKAYATAHGIDLIVMVRRRHSLNRLLFGSIGERLLLSQDVPILFVPAREKVLPRRGCRILAPLDGSPAGEAVLQDAANLARALNGSLTLTRVLGPLTYASGEPASEVGSLIDEAGVYGETLAQEYLDSTAERLAAEGVKTRRYTVPGEKVPAAVRKTAARERVHVVALAPRSANGSIQFASNSVTEPLLRRAETALLARRQSRAQA